LAKLARHAWGLNGGRVTSQALAGILQVPERSIEAPPEKLPKGIPIGLTVQKGDSERLKFFFRRSHRQSRRFESVRFLADWLMHREVDRWFPETDAATARQRVQRAFAAEFLCPIDELTAVLGDDLSDDSLENAALYFDVSARTIVSHLVNHHLMPRQEVTWGELPFE
jgi:hypothetical protein